MSEETPPTEAPAAKKPSKGLLIGAVAGAMMAGLGAGVVAIGPALAKPADAAAAPTDSATAEGEHGPATDTTAAAAPVVLNNVVMNPAGSRGTRFLLVSVGFEFSPAITPEAFANRETEIRDAVIATLSSKTVDDLVDYTRRDGYRTEIAAAVEKLTTGSKVRRVFFPQFVIQ